MLAVLSDDSSPTPPARSQRHPGRFGAPTHVAVLAALCHHAAVQIQLTSNVEPGKHDARNKSKKCRAKKVLSIRVRCTQGHLFYINR